ncbi:MAG: hypothetical protein ACRDYW_13545 [Acidimicrobiales bacterium]
MRRAPLAVLALLLLGAACGDDDGDAVRRASTTTTDAGPTSTTSADGTTSTTEITCQPARLPDDASDLEEGAGDVDGDGRVDELRSYRTADGWHVQVELASGGGADLSAGLTDAGGFGVIGGADVDGDGADEVWARTGAGASAVIVGLARLDGCSLTRVALESGEAADFPAGGSVGTAAGLECAATDPSAHVTTYTASNTGDTTYTVEVVEHRLDGNVLREVARRTETTEVGDDLFARATAFRCGDLAL